MNRLSTAKRVQIIKALVEGNSLRSITRMVGCSINTVTKLLVDLGVACEAFHDAHVRNVPSQRVQCDEIWTFCYARKETFLKRCAACSATAICGRGSARMPIRVSCCRGMLAVVMPKPRSRSCTISQHALRRVFS
jgi:hypothetical protein